MGLRSTLAQIIKPVTSRVRAWRFGRAAPTVSDDDALALSDILTCVRVLAESMASLPLDLYHRTADGRKGKAYDHPLQELIRWQPNPETTSYELRLWLMIDALLRGNGAAQVVRDGNGTVLQIWPLYSAKLTAARSESGEVMFSYRSEDHGVVSLKSSEVLLIKSFASGSLFSPSLTSLASDLFSGAKAAEEYTREFFTNGTTLSGTIEIPGEMGDEAFERFKEDWIAAHTGEGGRHKTPVLEGGAKFNPIALNHQETQMLETRKYTRTQIAGLYRVPAHLINDLERSTNSNIENQDLGFMKHTLRPWMSNFEQRFRMTLLNDEEKKLYHFKHNANDLLRGDLASRYAAYGIGVQNGILSPNVCLRKEDEPTYDGGDVHMANGNLLPVDTITKKSNAEGDVSNELV